MIFDVTFRLWLVMNAAWPDARKKTALAMSSGWPSLPIGVRDKTLFLLSGSSFKALSYHRGRMPGAYGKVSDS